MLDCEGPAPPDGARVAVLPGEEAVPWPRGPEPGPRAREGRFHAQASLLPDELRVLDPWPAPGLLARWREACVRRLEELDGRARAGGLVPALLLGSTRSLSHELQESFGRTGTRHILSVSGLHVGLVTWVAALCSLRLAGSPLARRRIVSTLGLLALYAALTGAQPPVVRAALAGGLFLLAPLLGAPRGARAGGRRPDGLSLWSLALLLELARDPLAAQRVGVQLSYLATLGLLLWNRSRPRWSAPRTRTSGLPSAAASARRALARPLAGAAHMLAASVQASCAAVLASLPIVWHTFGEWSPLGVVATPLSLPFVFLLMVLGAAECLAPGLAPTALVAALAGALRALFDTLDQLPGTPVPLPPRPLFLVAAAVGATFVALLGHQRWRSAARRAACGLWAGLLVPWTLAPRAFELVALDVGAGTCVVARAPGLPALVFDAGSRNRHDVYGEALGPLLRAWDVAAPVVVLSHLDRDHASALEPLVTRHPPRLWAGPLPDDLPLPDGTPRLDVGRGSLELPLAAGLQARLVRGSEEAGNEGSRSLLLGDARAGRVLLCGDAEGAGLAYLLRAPLVRGPLALLLFPHHGSETPELGRLLSQLAPAEVWTSAEGEPAVARELERRGQAWRTTGRDGPLWFPARASGGEKAATAPRSASSVPW